MSTFEEQMRAAFAETDSTPTTATPVPVGSVAVEPITIKSMPSEKRTPTVATLLRNEAGEITGMVMEPLESVARNEFGEIDSYVYQKAGR